MALPCHMQLEDRGKVTEDDGITAWRRVHLDLRVAGRILQADILVDGYSGLELVKVLHDPIGLEPQCATALLLESYRVGGETMRWIPSDMGEAFFDLERLIRDLFYRVQAETLIRQFHSAV